MKTLDARSLPTIAQEDLRRKAVKAVLDGKTQVEVAKLFGITRQAVGKWMKAYREGGVKKLKAKRKGRPKGCSLLPWQAAQIVKAIVGRNPDQLTLTPNVKARPISSRKRKAAATPRSSRVTGPSSTSGQPT